MTHKYRPRKLTITAAAILLLATLAPLAACGIKPADVDPPVDVERDSFPRTYPDPATDPAPRPDPERLIR